MEGSIRLSAEERKMLLSAVQREAPTARRANIVLLAAKGWSYRQIREAVFASFDLIAKCLAGFVRRGCCGHPGEAVGTDAEDSRLPEAGLSLADPPHAARLRLLPLALVLWPIGRNFGVGDRHSAECRDDSPRPKAVGMGVASAATRGRSDRSRI